MKSIKIITKEETNVIREMYATGVPSQNALANHVGTSRYYIGKMVRDIVPDALRIRHSVYGHPIFWNRRKLIISAICRLSMPQELINRWYQKKILRKCKT